MLSYGQWCWRECKSDKRRMGSEEEITDVVRLFIFAFI